mmetsp:Transcript_3456/g.8242  ORF Transcript_3456/g.8242 Transcript_3456/m.8242 type:complete len:116 (+) Transcript_3456:1236-1583(+)
MALNPVPFTSGAVFQDSLAPAVESTVNILLLLKGRLKHCSRRSSPAKYRFQTLFCGLDSSGPVPNESDCKVALVLCSADGDTASTNTLRTVSTAEVPGASLSRDSTTDLAIGSWI